MSGHRKLVIGASGFLGSHVARQLVADGEDVKVMIRPTSSTKGFDDLAVERCYGDVFDDVALRAAMADCDVVYYCVVDARYWLRDPSAMFRTNVEGLRHVLDAALEADLSRFVFTSSNVALAVHEDRPVTEDDPHNWDGGHYVQSRVAAEQLVMSYAREKGLPAVAVCPAMTFGARDWQPTPHGEVLAQVAAGRFPFYPDYACEVVGIEDAARAMLLAAKRGRIGERYIVSDAYLSNREVFEIAAEAVGVRPPRIKLPMGVLYAGGYLGDVAARLLHRDFKFGLTAARLADSQCRLDHGKAERELGWTPEPVQESIRAGARFFQAQRAKR